MEIDVDKYFEERLKYDFNKLGPDDEITESFSFAEEREKLSLKNPLSNGFKMILQTQFSNKYNKNNYDLKTALEYTKKIIADYSIHYYETLNEKKESWSYAISKLDTKNQNIYKKEFSKIFSQNYKDALKSRAAAISLYSATADALGAPFEFLERIDPRLYPENYCKEISKNIGQPVGKINSQHLFLYLNKRKEVKKIKEIDPYFENSYEIVQFPLELKTYMKLKKSFGRDNKQESKRFVSFYGRDSYNIVESGMIGAELTSEGFYDTKFCGYWTDDTCQSLCLADVLIKCGGQKYENFNPLEFGFSIYDWWNHSYNVPLPHNFPLEFELENVKLLDKDKDMYRITSKQYEFYIKEKTEFVRKLISQYKDSMFMSFGLGHHEKMFLMYLMKFLEIEEDKNQEAKSEKKEKIIKNTINENSEDIKNLNDNNIKTKEMTYDEIIKKEKEEKEIREFKSRKVLLEKSYFLPISLNGKDMNGDGTLMRNSPICAFSIRSINTTNNKLTVIQENVEKTMELAMLQSFTTQNGYASAQCCAIHAYVALHLAIIGTKCEVEFYNQNNNKKNVKIIDYYKKIHKEKQILMSSEIFWNDCKTILSKIWNRVMKSKQEKDSGLVKQDFYDLEEPVLQIINRTGEFNWCTKNLGIYNKERWNSSPNYVGIYVCDSLYMALNAVYRCCTPYSIFVDACCRGGDADTLGAIAGSLCGALYGVWHLSPNWVTSIGTLEKVTGEIAARGVVLSLILSNDNKVTDKINYTGNKN